MHMDECVEFLELDFSLSVVFVTRIVTNRLNKIKTRDITEHPWDKMSDFNSQISEGSYTSQAIGIEVNGNADR